MRTTWARYLELQVTVSELEDALYEARQERDALGAEIVEFIEQNEAG